MDEFEERGKFLDFFLIRIEGLRVVVVIFFENYIELNWCLKEVEKMNECREKGNLVVIFIFYKVELFIVRGLKGDFGYKLWILVKGDEKRKK